MGAATASTGAAVGRSTTAVAAASALLPGSPSSAAAPVAPSVTIVLPSEATGVAAGASPSTTASGNAGPATAGGSPQAPPVVPPAQSGPQTKPVAGALDSAEALPAVVASGQSAAPGDGTGAGTAADSASSAAAAAVSTPTLTAALAATTASARAALSVAGSSGGSPPGHAQAQATATADGSNVQPPPAGKGQTHAGGHDGARAQGGNDGAGWSLAASTSSLSVSSAAGPQAGLEAAGAAAPSAQAALAWSEAESAPLLASGVDLQGVIDAIRATVEIAARAGITQARIALQPQSLGDIRIHLSQTSDGLLARVMAGTPAAAQALAAGHTELRHSLSSLGLSLLRLDIGSFGSTEAQAQGREDRLAGGSAEGGAATVSRSAGAEDAEALPEADSTQPPSPLAAGGLVNVLA